MVVGAGRAPLNDADETGLPEPPPVRAAAVLRETAVATLLGLLVAIVTTWPLAAQLPTLAENVADAPFQAWTIDHVQWAITGGGPLWDAPIFAPNKNTLAYSDSLIGVAVPLLPLRWLGIGPLSQLNIALLLGSATSVGGGYLFGRVVSGRRTVGALTGVAFAFGAFGAASAAHLHATIHVGVAVAATATWWLADRASRGRPLTAPVVAMVLAVVWQASVSFYPGAYALAAVALVAALRWRDLGRRGAVALGTGLLASAVGCGLLVLPYLELLREDRDFVRTADEVAGLGIDLFRVDQRSVVWGQILGKNGAGAFPGVTLIALSLVGAVSGLRSEDARLRRTALAGLVLLGVGLFLATGTSSEGWRAWSPYRLLFEYVPGFKVLRGAARAWIIGLLGIGLLAGTGCTAVAAWTSRRRVVHLAVAALAVVGVVAEGFAPWSDRPTILVSHVDKRLAAEPREGGVLYLPALVPAPPALALATTFGQLENLYGATAHHRITPNGYSGLAPAEWPALSKRMQDIPSTPALDELRSLGVRFVVVRSEVVSTPWEPLLDPAQAAPLVLIGRYGDDLLYELP